MTRPTGRSVAPRRAVPHPVEARIRELEAERRRVFADAQREADAVFAQYQLSQLLAAGGSVAEIATAVTAEVARAVGADTAALWLAPPGVRGLDLVATDPPEHATGPSAAPAVPRSFSDVDAARAWGQASGWSGTPLPEGRSVGSGDPAAAPAGEVGYLAVRAGEELAPGHARYLAGVRQQLAVTLRAAQLRTWLAREQATLAAILEGATDAIVAVDSDQRVVRLNAAAAALLGAPPRAGTGMHCSEFLGCTGFDEADAAAARSAARAPTGAATLDRPGFPPAAPSLCGGCPFVEVLGSGQAIIGREIEVRHRDGTRIPVAATVSRMPTPDGGAVGVLRDLRAARSLEAAKTSFVAAVSHELRTPLALIDGYTQSLLELDLDAATSRRHLERIAAAARRLAGLVDEIIDVGQIESDALVLRRSPVALDDLVRAYLAERAEWPGSRPVDLRISRSLPRVDVDGPRIRQVIENLVENAEKHAGPAARIRLRARRLGEATVVLTVADDGSGIPAEDRDHLFERFARGRRAREAAVPGSGLGLYLCRRIAEAHGGWIRLDATTRGTSVSVGLPVVAGAPVAASARPVAAGAGKGLSP
jgi:signal transduction histidine kinase